MRLFLAIELAEPVRRHLVKLAERFRPIARASYVRPENLHLTLKFLGQVPDERVKEICDALELIPKAGPFELAVDRVECFPERGRVRVIGMGMVPPPQLLTLVNRIEATCKPLGFPLEGRPYTAHITLARAREPLQGSIRAQLVEAAKDLLPGPIMAVTQFVLMQSILKREVAEYTPAAHFAV
jgi:2'-5' RNA ligase